MCFTRWKLGLQADGSGFCLIVLRDGPLIRMGFSFRSKFVDERREPVASFGPTIPKISSAQWGDDCHRISLRCCKVSGHAPQSGKANAVLSTLGLGLGDDRVRVDFLRRYDNIIIVTMIK
jgi:hypothetical protein